MINKNLSLMTAVKNLKAIYFCKRENFSSHFYFLLTSRRVGLVIFLFHLFRSYNNVASVFIALDG